MSSIILTRVGVYVCVCLYARTHTHCTDGPHGCEPRSLDETPGGPEESRWTKSRHTYIRICVQSTQVYIYMLRGGLRSWTNCFGPKLGTYNDWGLSSVLVINKHLSHHVFSFEKSRRCDDN